MLLGSKFSVKGFPRLRLCRNRAPSESSETCKPDGTKGDSVFYILNKYRFFYCFTNKQICTWKQLQYHLVPRDDASAEVCLSTQSFDCAFKPCCETFNYFPTPNYRQESACLLSQPHGYTELAEARMMWAEVQMQLSLLRISTEDSPLPPLTCQAMPRAPAPNTWHLLSLLNLRISITQAHNPKVSFPPQSLQHFCPILPTCSIICNIFLGF